MFIEGMRSLGHGFFAPIIRDLILPFVRYYKLYAQMAAIEDSTDEVDVKEFSQIRDYLEEECPKFMIWMFHDGDSPDERQTRKNALNEDPISKFLHFLEKTSARTTQITLGIRDNGKTLNADIIKYCHDYLVQYEFGSGKPGRDTPRPDPVLLAVVKELHNTLLSGLKSLMDKGRLRALDRFTKKIGLLYFRMDSSGRSGVDVSIPKPEGDAAPDNISGLCAVPETNAYENTDEHGFPIPIPYDVEDVLTLVDQSRVIANSHALKALKKKYRHMVCDVTLTKYVAEKKKKFDDVRCARIMDRLEDTLQPGCTEEPPESVTFQHTTAIHSLGVRMLCDLLDVEDPIVLLASHVHSLRAIHAVSLTILGVLREHEVGDSSKLTPLLRAHKGPVTLYYNTNEAPTWVGVVGVMRLPSKRPEPLPNYPVTQVNQFQYDMSCLNADYKEHLKNMMFISPAERDKNAPRASATGHGVVGERRRGAAEGGTGAAPVVQDDGIGAPLGNMSGDY